MSTGALQKLTIEHLRGALAPFSLLFERGKKLTILYGENGSGKSTVCDALEFLGNGKVGSLDGRGLGRTERYWPSVGKGPADVVVILETSDGTCRATLGSKGVVAVPADQRPKVEVLRRKQILDLLEATPGNRYEAIRRFIDVSPIDMAEQALRSAIRDLDAGRQQAVARVQENRDQLGRFWEEAGTAGTDPLQWAAVEAGREPADRSGEREAVTALRTAFARLAERCESLAPAAREAERAAAIESEVQLSVLDLEREATEDASTVVAVLEAAQFHFEEHPAPEACPLCASSDRVLGLPERVKQRLSAFSALRSARGDLNHKRSLSAEARQRLYAKREEVEHAAQQWKAALNDPRLPEGLPLPSELPEDSVQWPAWRDASALLDTSWEQRENTLTDLQKFHGTLRSTYRSYTEKLQEQSELDAVLPAMRRALEIVEEERRTFTDAILSEIATEVGRVYEEVHPGEGLERISLELDPRRRASLEIGASFNGQPGLPPMAYFSESHLDTLGLCVFLVLAARDGASGTVLILDDVLASVDEPHVERLIEMLYAQSARFRHCVMTTHYRPWKEKLRWGWLKNGQCQFVELARWTAADGLTLTRTLPDIVRLRQLLTEDPPDLQGVTAKAGVVLERVLDFFTLLYGCSVPRRSEARYTLGELLPALDKKLRVALRIEKKHVGEDSNVTYTSHPLGTILDELSQIAQARNVFGCHYNELSEHLGDADALRFTNRALELAELVVDAEAGWPKNDRSGSYWASSGESRRLHPLRRPG